MVSESSAQSTIYQNSVEKEFNDALGLFQKDQYAAAKFSFEHLKEKPLDDAQKVDIDFYHAASALGIENPEAPSLLRDFLIKYPKDPKSNDAAHILGDYFFEQRDYRSAIEHFRLVNTNKTSLEQRADVLFKTGYAFFQLKDHKNAGAYFEQVKTTQTNYVPDAYYYAGYIAMEAGDFEKAIQELKEADKSQAYSDKVPYMLSALYYRQKDFKALIGYATPILDSRGGLDKKEEIYLLLAEASFENKDYVNAANYYDAYVKGRKGSLTRDQQYKAGVSQYEVGNFQQASNYFKEVALENDKLGQVSSYYLGHAYLKLNNPQFASTSFSTAYKSDHDQNIQEEALYNYAKVNLERGSFQDAVMALDNYLDAYPQGAHVRDVENLLSEALINTNNYLRAIAHIEKLNDKSNRIKAAYQKVTFYQGITYYKDGKYTQALNYFDKSQTYPLDKDILVQSHFWKGETHAVNNNLLEAAKAYEAGLASSPNANDPYLIKTHYGLGYAYFNSDQYSKAETQFKSYTDKLQGKSNKENYDEALVRLGDTYYVQKKFSNALITFRRAIEERNLFADYAYFRAGVVLNFENRNREAIQQLDELINNYPNSIYVVDAIFQKAQINMEESRYAEARDGFSQLINSKPNSPFVPFALESRAIANYSLKNYDETINDYKKILDNHPNANNANAALVGLQETLSLEGRSGEFSNYLASYKSSNPDNASLQNLEFEAAKNLFFNQAYKESIASFEEYLKNYPESGQNQEANYFIGDAYYRLGDKSTALQYFYELEKINGSTQKTRAIQKISEIEFENKNYEKAIPYFISASKNARNKIEEYEAFKGLMESYYYISKFDSSTFYADKVIELGNITADSESTALLIKAKSLLEQTKGQEAEEALMFLINEYKTQQGAEALFLLALNFHEQKNYTQSNEIIFDFSGPFGVYDFWYGKSFVLLAKNYMEMGETFQAKATLESIVEKSSNEEIKKEAGEMLQTLN
ncbi:MAG: tetratricopeptide repeat protein [Anditalea sp.]